MVVMLTVVGLMDNAGDDSDDDDDVIERGSDHRGLQRPLHTRHRPSGLSIWFLLKLALYWLVIWSIQQNNV